MVYCPAKVLEIEGVFSAFRLLRYLLPHNEIVHIRIDGEVFSAFRLLRYLLHYRFDFDGNINVRRLQCLSAIAVFVTTNHKTRVI